MFAPHEKRYELLCKGFANCKVDGDIMYAMLYTLRDEGAIAPERRPSVDKVLASWEEWSGITDGVLNEDI